MFVPPEVVPPPVPFWISKKIEAPVPMLCDTFTSVLCDFDEPDLPFV